MAGRKKKFTHPRLMTVDPNFAPCSTKENDEIFINGIFKFNISRMLADIEAGILNAVPIQIDVKEWYRDHYHHVIKEEHLPKVDPSQPILIAEIKEGNYTIFDGHHRMEKARRSGQERIDAFQLTGEEIIPYFITQNGYESYVSYWNGKLEEQERDRDWISRRASP